MKAYETTGTYIKHGKRYKFTKKVNAETERAAKEILLSQMGGKQNLRRGDITIATIKVA